MVAGDIKLRFPELTAISDERILFFIGDALPFFDVERWGDFYPVGLASYVAHMLTVDQQNQVNPGSVFSGSSGGGTVKVGDVSITSDTSVAAKTIESSLYETRYGRDYLMLRRMVGAGGLAV